MTTISIAQRFCGPPASGNGGYVAGRLAAVVAEPGTPVTVTLRQPPPLEQALTVEQRDGVTVLVDAEGTLVAEAVAAVFAAEVVAPVDVDVARAAHASYAGLDDHSFDGCFVCGPGRAEGDGLKLCPGLIGDGLTACVWTPDGSLADTADPDRAAAEFVWAALDCPGGWTSDLVARPLVLGRMTAAVSLQPRIGEPVVVVGQLLSVAGRKTLTATTAYDPHGAVVGRAEQTWIEVDPAVFYPGSTASGGTSAG